MSHGLYLTCILECHIYNIYNPKMSFPNNQKDFNDVDDLESDSDAL